MILRYYKNEYRQIHCRMQSFVAKRMRIEPFSSSQRGEGRQKSPFHTPEAPAQAGRQRFKGAVCRADCKTQRLPEQRAWPRSSCIPPDAMLHSRKLSMQEGPPHARHARPNRMFPLKPTGWKTLSPGLHLSQGIKKDRTCPAFFTSKNPVRNAAIPLRMPFPQRRFHRNGPRIHGGSG